MFVRGLRLLRSDSLSAFDRVVPLVLCEFLNKLDEFVREWDATDLRVLLPENVTLNVNAHP